MVRSYLLFLIFAALCLCCCAASTNTTDKLSIVVTRGPESWQFFAFMFFVFYSLGVNIGGTLGEACNLAWLKKSASFRVAFHIMWFGVCFYLTMMNGYCGNKLVGFLISIKQWHP
jgi:hypothetical protein